MRYHTEIAVYEGDMFHSIELDADCHICGDPIPHGNQRLRFASIQAGDDHSATISWCETCKPCGLQIIEAFKPRREKADAQKTVVQQPQPVTAGNE